MSQNYEYFGKYILLQKLATGGMAEIYLAKAPGAGGVHKFVAIKRILPQYSDVPDFIEMFKDEAKIAINLNHSNIVSIYEFGVEKKQFFLVMDYVEGKNLRQIGTKLKENKNSMSVSQILYVLREAAAGLDSAHRCLDGTTGRPLNITHRDISPQNIMISFEGEVKIVDFGIAKAESQLETTRAGTLKGKFGYMSPEQAEGLPTVDLRTDIFSLGIVLWELLAGERLFISNNEVNTLRKIRECRIPSLRKLNPSVPIELERIANKALARDRNLRYQTAAAYHKDLNRFLNVHYPDFSPHDFSLFVKKSFETEILETRRRLVEYASVDFNEDQLDKTEVTSTLTDTISNATSSFPNEIQSQEFQAAPAQGSPGPKNNSSHTNRGLSHGATRALPAGPSSLREPKLVIENEEDPDRPDLPPLPPLDLAKLRTKPGPSRPSPSDERRKKSRGVMVGSSSSSSQQPSPASSAESPLYPSYRRNDGYDPYRNSYEPNISRGGRGGPALFIAILALIAAAYLNSNPDVVEKILSMIRNTDMSSKKPPVSKEDDGPPVIEKHSLLVTSNPSGAEIIIDGKNTSVTTPGIVMVEPSKPFVLELDLKDYEKFTRRLVSSTKVGRFSAVLKSEEVGFLDIHVLSGNATIYINGRKVDQELPIKNYRVPADVPVEIKAINPFTKTEDTKRVKVGKDKQKKVTLFLKKVVP